MNELIAKPHILKKVNLSQIRKAIKNKGTVTRAEITKETKISSTTVRSLLTEMQLNGEIESIGYAESSGGRKAEKYRLKPDRYYGAAFCIAESDIHYLIVDIFGKIVETGILGQRETLASDITKTITCFLDDLINRKEIKSIGLGVPGVVEDVTYLKFSHGIELDKIDVGSFFTQRYGIPVVLENDINAITIGFARRIEQLQQNGSVNANLVLVYFGKGIGAGIIAGERIIRGWSNFAGEIGLIPQNGQKILSEQISEADDALYTTHVIQIICWICALINPKTIALAGPDFRGGCFEAIRNGVNDLFPQNMRADILYSPDIWNDYNEGMAFLTAGRIFDEIQFTKELL